MVEDTKKIKKKRWITILPTENFRIPEIGETFTAEPSKLVGKTVSVSLMELMKDPKRQNLKITFKIIEVKDNKALTEIKKYEMVPSSIKRLVRPGKSKLDASFKFTTKDKIKIIIKPVIITKSKTTNPVLAKLRKETESYLSNFITKADFAEVFGYVMGFKLQNQLKSHLKKIYPVSLCHIRILEKQ